MATFELTLDVRKSTRIIQQQVVVRQWESGTETIVAKTTNDGAPYASRCPSARLDILHSDGTWARVEATKAGDTVTVTLPGEAIPVYGVCRLAHFVLFDADGNNETTEDFELRIIQAVDANGSEVDSYDDRLTKIEQKWAALEAKAEIDHSADRQASMDATAAANGAASRANAAASQALQIANSVAQGSAGDSDIAALREQNAILANMLAESSGKFVFMDGTVYAPSSKATFEDGTVKLGSSCTVSGTTIVLA